MIRYVSISMVFLIMMLAILSRKNFSKYKGVKNGKDPFWCLSVNIASRLERKSRIRGYIQRIKPLNKLALNQETDLIIEKYIHDTLVILVAFLMLVFGMSFMPESESNPRIIQRPDIGMDKTYVDLKLTDEVSQETSVYHMEVYPREYTKEEFEKTSKEVKEYIDSVILGENKDVNHITNDLVFPKTVKNKGVWIIWDTDNPVVLGTDGKINRDEMENDTVVNITATIKDSNYSDEYKLMVKLIKDISISNSEKTKVTMLNIEGENRSEKELVIPEYIGNVKIDRVVETTEQKITFLFIFGLIVIGIWMYYRIYKLKEKAEKRDTEISDAYYGFTNRLAIYIGAGFTLQKSFKAAIKNEACENLVNEIEYTLNMIGAGISESKAYYELGRRLGTEEYMRLMSLISQNLSFGNSNLLKLLDAEASNSFFLKKERTRKKGEQASEKLLIPTLVLLVLVIVVVMYPAFIGMK